MNDSHVKDLLKALEGRLNDTKFETVRKLDFPSEGIEFTFDKSEILTGVHLFSGGLDGKMGYTRELPFSVEFSDRRSDVIRKSGMSPEGSGGGDIWNEKVMPYWDRFKVDGALVHFQYSRDDTCVELVTLMYVASMPQAS